MARLKTGTPPRLDGRTIDWARLEEQPSDAEHWCMSPVETRRVNPQLFCAITRTNEACMNDPCQPPSLALFSGAIGARGRAIAPASRTRSTASPTATATRFSSNPKGSTTHGLSQRLSTSCPPMCNRR
jgi:tRNA uridine 5-carboxymethylaminomethyl modification enzyme